MKIGSMKEVRLSNAQAIYLFDCRVAGLEAQTLNEYRAALRSFIRFTGDILVKELTPDHVRVYMDNLSDGPSEGEQHIRAVINHYAMIHTWIRWLYAQKFVFERSSSLVKPPRFTKRGGLLFAGCNRFSPDLQLLSQKGTRQQIERALGVKGSFCTPLRVYADHRC